MSWTGVRRWVRCPIERLEQLGTDMAALAPASANLWLLGWIIMGLEGDRSNRSSVCLSCFHGAGGAHAGGCRQAVAYEDMRTPTCTVSALAQRQVPLRWVADEIMMEMWLSILRPDRYQMRYNRGAVWERILLRRERGRGSHWCPSAWIPSLNRSLCPAWRSVARCFRAEQGQDGTPSAPKLGAGSLELQCPGAGPAAVWSKVRASRFGCRGVLRPAEHSLLFARNG